MMHSQIFHVSQYAFWGRPDLFLLTQLAYFSRDKTSLFVLGQNWLISPETTSLLLLRQNWSIYTEVTSPFLLKQQAYFSLGNWPISSDATGLFLQGNWLISPEAKLVYLSWDKTGLFILRQQLFSLRQNLPFSPEAELASTEIGQFWRESIWCGVQSDIKPVLLPELEFAELTHERSELFAWLGRQRKPVLWRTATNQTQSIIKHLPLQ